MARTRLPLLALVLALLVACGPLAPSEPTVGHWTDYDDGSAALLAFGDEVLADRLATGPARFIVSRNGRLGAVDAFAVRRGDAVHVFQPEAGFAVVETSDPAAYRRFGDIVVRDAVVTWREPTTVVAFESDLADPPFSGSADFFFDLQWGHVPVGAVAAWHAGVRGQDVTVAVLDGGFDLTHPDLAPNIDVDRSRNFVDGEELQYGLPDPFSHGAHVAGTIGAAQNDFGVIGVAPDVSLMLLKVLGDEGSGSFGDIIAGMIYAAEAGADIANMSLGASLPQRGFSFEDDEGTIVVVGARDVAQLRVAMQRAANYGTWSGTLYISSAGNDALDLTKTADLLVLPAGLQRVVSVSATAPIGWATDPLQARFDNLASYSNYGKVDVSAPGGDFVYSGDEDCAVAGVMAPCWVFDLVFSTGAGTWYWSLGTSMAAPHASGVAALILAEAGGSGALTPAQLEQALYQRALDLGKPGRDEVHGRGAVFSGYSVAP
jgi:lantibiotic leader peptide-processing serine protease